MALVWVSAVVLVALMLWQLVTDWSGPAGFSATITMAGSWLLRITAAMIFMLASNSSHAGRYWWPLLALVGVDLSYSVFGLTNLSSKDMDYIPADDWAFMAVWITSLIAAFVWVCAQMRTHNTLLARVAAAALATCFVTTGVMALLEVLWVVRLGLEDPGLMTAVLVVLVAKTLSAALLFVLAAMLVFKPDAPALIGLALLATAADQTQSYQHDFDGFWVINGLGLLAVICLWVATVWLRRESATSGPVTESVQPEEDSAG